MANRKLVGVLLALIATLFANGVLAGVAGEVMYADGYVGAGQLKGKAVLVGSKVSEGDDLVTGSDGHLHVKLIDGGLLVLRPNAHAKVLDYVVNLDEPSRSRMRIQVFSGVVRSVTGAGGKAAKGQFRVNTPIAALGVRGTDFTIFADANVTRAAVNTGGIVMTPLGAACREQDVGPCEGALSAELFAGNPRLVVQFSSGNPKPVIIDARQLGIHPDTIAPPSRQEFPAGQASKAEPVKGTPMVNGDVSLESRVAESIATSNNIEPVMEPEPQRVVWGRWSVLLDPNQTSKISDGRAMVASNAKFGLFRDNDPSFVMPLEGTASFRLANQESFFYEMSTSRTTAASMENAKLSFDFGKRTFATSFDLHGGAYSTSISAQGGMFEDGRFRSSVIQSNASVSGALAGVNASQAGFVFHQPLNNRITAYGASYWTR